MNSRHLWLTCGIAVAHLWPRSGKREPSFQAACGPDVGRMWAKSGPKLFSYVGELNEFVQESSQIDLHLTKYNNDSLFEALAAVRACTYCATPR